MNEPRRTPDRRTSENAVKAKFGSAPVRWAWISPVVVPLRVATPCYTTKQRTLLGRGIPYPKRCHHAALGWQELARPGACYGELPRIPIPRTWVNKGKIRAEVSQPRPSFLREKLRSNRYAHITNVNTLLPLSKSRS